MLRPFFTKTFLIVSFSLAGCQAGSNASETESSKGKKASQAGTCAVYGRSLLDPGPAIDAPVTLDDGSKSWVGAGIKVSPIEKMNDPYQPHVKAKVLGGSNQGKIVTFLIIHLDCGPASADSPAKSSSSVDPSIAKNIPWANYYKCVVKSSSNGNAEFKRTDDSIINVGNDYEVAVPSAEINNISVNVYVLKGGVVAGGTKGSMQKADLAQCTEDKSI